jgi:hypothetical protein
VKTWPGPYKLRYIKLIQPHIFFFFCISLVNNTSVKGILLWQFQTIKGYAITKNGGIKLKSNRPETYWVAARLPDIVLTSGIWKVQENLSLNKKTKEGKKYADR